MAPPQVHRQERIAPSPSHSRHTPDWLSSRSGSTSKPRVLRDTPTEPSRPLTYVLRSPQLTHVVDRKCGPLIGFRIARTRLKNKSLLRTGETKSRRSRRVIALDGQTVAILRDHKRRQNEERLRAGEAWTDLDLVFTNELGEPVNPMTFTRWTKRLATEAGVPPLTPHDAARHGWATLALSAGVAPKVVQERLGHSSISITMDRYSHVIEGMDRAAAETVAALIEHSSG